MDVLTANDKQGTYPASYYAAAAEPMADFAEARGEITCDVCVIGGGFTGLSTALHLAQKGYDVVLLEAHRLGWGASGRNGGQVSTGQRVDQDALEKLVGIDRARSLWNLSIQSMDVLLGLIKEHKIDCDYSAGIIHADHRVRFVPHSHAYAEKLNREYDYDKIRPLDQNEIRELVGSKAYFGGTFDSYGGHVQPLKLALGLARAGQKAGVRFFENSRVASVAEGGQVTVKTAAATVKAKYLVMGCNGYLGNLHKNAARRLMPINNFIVATEPLSPKTAKSLIKNNDAVADSRYVINYFRLSKDNRMLFGGGETYGMKFPKDIAALVRKPMLQVYPQLVDTKIDYAWGGTLGITMSRLPHFERMRGNIISAGGFSGHGVAMGTFAGHVVAEAIAGQAERFDLMASVPTPRFPGGTALRWPMLVLAMSWYAMLDRF